MAGSELRKRVNESYEKKKEHQRQRDSLVSAVARDIGNIPPPADPKRRAKGEGDFLFFLTTYFPNRFNKKFSPDHKKLIKHLERVVISGGLKAFAMPRGSGKTTLCECAALWAILTGRRSFVVLVGASKDNALAMLESVKSELADNELLAEDWPEVCIPIQKLEGIANRCAGQTHNGQKTDIKWGADKIVLPTISSSKASGAILVVRGINSAMRGLAHTHKGFKYRPDLCICDDPQDDKSAANAVQVAKRLNIITGTILGLAGPNRKMAVCLPMTVIKRFDLADQLLDREKNPAFQGEKTKLMNQWPTNEKLWDEYAEIRRACQRMGDDLAKEATKFYRKNRKAMDEGGIPSWPQRFDVGEISAIQFAYNKKIDSPFTFDAEFQNEPLSEISPDEEITPAAVIIKKVNGLAKHVMPLGAEHVTAFIDVQQEVLFYVVMAWGTDLTGTVLDYGTFPEQHRSYFTLHDLRTTLSQQYPRAGVEGSIRAALDSLTDILIGRDYVREDGTKFSIKTCLIDSGNWTDTIYQFCRESKHSRLLLPSKGIGITADKCPMTEYKPEPGKRVGTHWFVQRPLNRKTNLLLQYDTNYWKSAVHAGLALAHGDRSSISLYGTQITDHQMLADHLTAEYKTKTEGRGRTVYVWKLADKSRDNHWFDCIVGAAVAASYVGCSTSPSLRPSKSTAQGPRVIKSTPLKC